MKQCTYRIESGKNCGQPTYGKESRCSYHAKRDAGLIGPPEDYKPTDGRTDRWTGETGAWERLKARDKAIRRASNE